MLLARFADDALMPVGVRVCLKMAGTRTLSGTRSSHMLVETKRITARLTNTFAALVRTVYNIFWYLLRIRDARIPNDKDRYKKSCRLWAGDHDSIVTRAARGRWVPWEQRANSQNAENVALSLSNQLRLR